MSDTKEILTLILEILGKNEVEAEKKTEPDSVSSDRPKQPPMREGAPQAVTQTTLRYRGVMVR